MTVDELRDVLTRFSGSDEVFWMGPLNLIPVEYVDNDICYQTDSGDITYPVVLSA